MSGHGSPTSQISLNANGLNVVVVAGQWHEVISEAMVASAVRTLEAAGATHSVIRVAGSFELPVVCKAVLDNGADAVVALGVIIRGGTPHFEFVSDAATQGLLRVALDTGKPVGFGVLTLDDEQQGLDRAGLPDSQEDKGEEAATAAIQAALTIRQIENA
jgi:6,7-dimethyl-8-ribityllumazine synthase